MAYIAEFILTLCYRCSRHEIVDRGWTFALHRGPSAG